MIYKIRNKIGAFLTTTGLGELVPVGALTWLNKQKPVPKPTSTGTWMLVASVVMTATFIAPDGGLALLIAVPVNAILLYVARSVIRHEARVELREQTGNDALAADGQRGHSPGAA